MRRAAACLLCVLLASASAHADEDLDRALRKLQSPNPQSRAEAAVQLIEETGAVDRDRILRALTARLADKNADVRRQVVLVLGRRLDKRAADAMAARLKQEPRREVLTALLIGLGDLGGEAHVNAIAHRGLTHAVPSVRAAAVTSLGRIGGPKARALVLETLRQPGGRDRDWSLRAAAMLALARCGAPEDMGEVHTLYRAKSGSEHWFARSAYARVVAVLDPDPLAVLEKLVGDPDRRVQVTAAVGIARRSPTQVLPRLLRHLVPSVRAAGASAVAQAKVVAQVPRLKTLARFDPSREVRWAAALALFRLEDPTGDALVVEAISAPEPAIWAEALAALATRTGEKHGRDPNVWRGALLRWRARQ